MAFSIRCERPVALRVAAAGSFFFLIFKNFFSPLSFFFLGGKKEKKLRPFLPWPAVVSNRRIVYRVFSSSRTLAEFFCDELVLWFLLGSVISSFS